MSLSNACNSVELSAFLTIVKRVLLFIQIIGPIICIISIIISFINFFSNPDDKKEMKKIINKVIALAILFFIPLIVNAVLLIMGDSNDISSCWNNSPDVVQQSNTYVDINSDKPTTIITSPDEYETGIDSDDSNND